MNYKELRYEKIRQLLLDQILAGQNTVKIVEDAMATHDISRSTAFRLFKDAKEEIRQKSLSRLNKLIPLHVARYENIYRIAKEMGYHLLAKKALRAKEKVLLLHNEYSKVKIENNFNAAGMASTIFDLTRLSGPQLDRLQELSTKIITIK